MDEKQELQQELDTLNTIKVDLSFAKRKIKDLYPRNSSREKALVVTKIEEAIHRVDEVIEFQKQLLL